MTEPKQGDSPNGALASTDAGAPSAFERLAERLSHHPEQSGDGDSTRWDTALAALEFPAVLERVAHFAAGPLGVERILARRPSELVNVIQGALQQVDELAGLERAGAGVVAEAVPDLAEALGRLRIGGSVLDPQELLAVRRTLTAGRLVRGELIRVEPDAPSSARLLVDQPDKSLEKRLEQSLDDDGSVRDSASPALAAARSDIRTARDRLLQRLEAMLRQVGGEGGVTLRDGRYVIPVARDLRGRPDGIIHGESASGATLYLEPAAAIPLGNALRESEARASREELKVLRDLTDRLRPHADAIRAVHEMCVAVDDLVARARYAAAVDGHLPRMLTAPASLVVVNGRHPLLVGDWAIGRLGDSTTMSGSVSALGPAHKSPNRSIAESPVVPFDLRLEPHERTVLLSGPNTGGKSVLLKAVGLHLALAQSGIIPPVGLGSALPVVRRIYADIGDRQSIAASLSTFSAHLTLLREILDEADAESLVLLDEIGSGTDPAEGAALAGASLLALTRRGTLTLATTHLGALKRLATASAGIVNASLQFDAATLQPTYRLQKGVPGRSYGLAIARRLGLREDVIAEAEGQVPEAERSLDALLAAVEQRQQEQDLRAAELQEGLADMQMRGENLAAQAALQKEREAALRLQEKNAERSAREQARQYLLEAREQVEQAIARAQSASEEAAREGRRLVEQAIKGEGEALRRLGDWPIGRLGDSDATPAVGDQVRLHSGTAGEVLEIRGDGKIIVRVGSLRMVAEAGTLTPIQGAGSESPNRPIVQSTNFRAAEPEYELDLRGLTGDEAEQAVIAAIDAAVLAEQPFIRIIHGKGTGVVRERVQQVAGADRRVASHAFAPANQGGSGVTIVELGS